LAARRSSACTRAASSRLENGFVGADREPHEQVGLVVAGGEHEDRHRPLGLDAPAHLEAVEAGQHHVEHDRVGWGAPGGGHRARPVTGDLDEEALGPQPGRDGVGDGPLVLDDEHPFLHRCHLQPACDLTEYAQARPVSPRAYRPDSGRSLLIIRAGEAVEL
jgi:hypothetical protein